VLGKFRRHDISRMELGAWPACSPWLRHCIVRQCKLVRPVVSIMQPIVRLPHLGSRLVREVSLLSVSIGPRQLSRTNRTSQYCRRRLSSAATKGRCCQYFIESAAPTDACRTRQELNPTSEFIIVGVIETGSVQSYRLPPFRLSPLSSVFCRDCFQRERPGTEFPNRGVARG